MFHVKHNSFREETCETIRNIITLYTPFLFVMK